LPFILFGLIGMLIILKAKGYIGVTYEPFALDMLKDLSDSGEKIDRAQAYPLSIATQSLLFFKYLGLWLLPNPIWMSVDMRERFASSLLNYLPAMALFLAYGAAALWLLLQRGIKGLFGFAMLFPWLLFATEFSTVRIQESFVLYRSYLWMAGIFAALPVLFCLVPARKAAVWLVLLCLFYVPLSLDRLQDFSNPLYLWDDAARLVEHKQDLPGVSRIYHNRGLSFAHVFMRDKALEDYNTALRLKPDDSYAYNDRGALFYDWGRYPEAMKDLDKAISLEADVGHFYWARGAVFEAMGNMNVAETNYKTGCELGEKRACDKLEGAKGK
jgi:tetratricopeptide (TPR) repeat protein